MKLGLIGWTVQRLLEEDGDPKARELDRIFQRASELGVQSLELGVGRSERTAFVDRAGELKERYGIHIELGYGPIVFDGDSSGPADAFAEYIETVCKPLGVTALGVVSPFHGGRWLREPPLQRQMDRLAQGLRTLAPVAEERGVYLAIENHADYRGVELAELIERVGSRAVGIKFDTGNVYCAIEDPLDAAEAVAPHTYMTHFKDVIVEAEPCNRGLPGGLLSLTECALGQGHVDLVAVVSTLAEKGPLGSDLVLTIECQPGDVEESVRWARRELATFLAA